MDGRVPGSGRLGVVGVRTAALVLTVLLAGCAGPEEPGDPGAAGSTDRPAEKRIRVEMEGLAEELRVVLYRSPPGFPLPFSTYVPEDIIVESTMPGKVAAVHFVAAFGGRRNEAAAMRLVVPVTGTTEDDVVVVLRDLARDLGTELVDEPEPRFAWSVREFRNLAVGSHAAAEGIMAVGRREGRLFAIALHHPAEYGDGFGPRAGVILDEWRWRDTGGGLGN